jgi:Cu-Zn family superoxide dismutase
MRFHQYFIAIASIAAATTVLADTTINLAFTAEQGSGKAAGTMTVSETKYGLVFTPHLEGLTPGIHGFHIHQHPACENNGMAAGGHLDPEKTNKHLGPYNDAGHLGDLPVIIVNADGTATLPVLAPRLTKISELNDHAMMIHDGGDNYSDKPAKLGGGGNRMVCGKITL